MRTYSHFIFGFIVLFLVSCGEDGQPVTLEGKKRMLVSKKDELKALNQEIQQLEAAILKEDPTLQAEARRTPVEVASITPGEFKHMVSVQGVVAADQNITVSPLTSGRITRIFVREGQAVRKGQVLAQLDDAVMRSSMAEVQAQLDLANILFEKQERLWNQKIGTEVQYLTAKSQKESLEKRLATLEEQLQMSKIKAPISGSIDMIYPKIGELASPGVPAFQIVNFSQLSIQADVPENYVAYIKRGDQVTVSFATLNRTINGKVNRVGQSINPAKRTFSVEVKLPNSKDFKPNMFGEIEINDRTLKDAISVPQSIVQKSDLGEFVYIAEEAETGKWLAKRVNIETGLSAADKVEVTSGLKAGDQLITVGYKNLSAGQEVVPSQAVANTPTPTSK